MYWLHVYCTCREAHGNEGQRDARGADQILAGASGADREKAQDLLGICEKTRHTDLKHFFLKLSSSPS